MLGCARLEAHHEHRLRVGGTYEAPSISEQDTHAVHISLGENGIDHTEGARVEHIIKGDTVNEVLKYVEFDTDMLMGKLRRDVEAAINAGRMQDTQAGRLLKFYEEALMGYTYLEDPNAD